jgi:hypothetical protein
MSAKRAVSRGANAGGPFLAFQEDRNEKPIASLAQDHRRAIVFFNCFIRSP